MKEYLYDVAVVGAGPAGLAAAISAKQNGAERVVLIERDIRAGGILQQCIHAGFGLQYFGEELTGPEYAERFADKAKAEGIDLLTETTALEIREKTLVCVNTSGVVHINFGALVLAMGCRERTRANLVIPGSRPSGVYTAGTAQKLINIYGKKVGKEVVILGSGDIGLIMARRMTLEGAKVLAVSEIMPFTNGLSRNVAQCLEDFGIPLYLSHTVTKVIGKNSLEGIEISQVDENMKPIPGTEKYFECDTLLLSVGLVPENELTRQAGINLDVRTRGASVGEDMQTTEEGVFACGNVLHVHDLVDYVSAESERAGRSAAKYVLGTAVTEKDVLNVNGGLNVGYTVPQRINRVNVEKGVDIFFRVRKKIRVGEIRVESNGEKIASFKREFLAPAEMEKITVPKVLLDRANGSITVSAIEVEEEAK